MKIDSTFPKIGFTGVNFSGKSVQIATGRKDRFRFGINLSCFNDRWVIFANWNAASPFHDLHESILSYQCVCRNGNVKA